MSADNKSKEQLRAEIQQLREELAVSRNSGGQDNSFLLDTTCKIIIEQSPISTQVFALDGKTLYVNPAWEKLWGVPLEALANYNVLQDQQLIERDLMHYVQTAFGGKIAVVPTSLYDTAETRNVSGGTGKCWVNVVMYPIKDEFGNVTQVIFTHEDVTTEKKASLESEEKYRGIFDESVATIYVFDHEKNFIDSNQAGLDLLGYSREELLNKSIADVDADQGVVVPAHKHLLSGGRIVNFEHRLVHRDGHIITVLNNSRPLTYSNGEVMGMQSTLIDITEHKQAELALNESIASQQAILAALPDLMFELDEDGRYLQIWSQKFDELAKSKDKLLGHTLSEMLPAYAAEQGMAALKEAADNGFSQGQKIYLTTPAGEQWFELSTSHIANSASPKRFIVLSRNITERNKIEKALSESEEKYRLLFEGSEDPMWIITENCFEIANAASAEILGYSNISELTNTHPSVISPEYQPNGRTSFEMANEMMAIAYSTGYHRFEWVHKRKDGNDFPVEVSLTKVPYEGRDALFCIWRDTTDRKKAEDEKARLQRELQQARKMESLGHLTGGIAHDFNNLLNIISGFTELSLNTVKDDLKLNGYLNHLKNASQRATNLVSQMLSFSRKNSADSSPMDIVPVLKEEVEMLRAILPTTIELDFEIEDKQLPAILMNPTQLQQMLMNLCINARDAMDGVGKLGIRLGWARNLDTESPVSHKPITGDWIELGITDTGSGIAADMIEEIFTPFFTTKEVGQGTGMGLSVVYGIMENHGGHILIESKPGKGTSLCLLFPPITKEVSVPSSTDSDVTELSAGHSENILIVDDEESIAVLMEEMLTNYGYQATITTDSIEALNLFKTNPDKFALIITDQTMPKLTGVELITQLREIKPNLPVILCSGFSNKINEENAEIKNIHYFSKPVDFTKLKIKLAQLLSVD